MASYTQTVFVDGTKMQVPVYAAASKINFMSGHTLDFSEWPT